MRALSALLQVHDLRVHYPGAEGPLRAVDGLTFALEQGETYALVGESGCGKSATGLAILRLVEPGRIAGGRLLFEGRELLDLDEKQMRSVRGARIGMVFQEPAAALDPVMRVGSQVAEALRVHKRFGRREALDEAVRLLGVVALPDPERQARAYPHELSGGMMQRVMLAIALSCSPALLIADEPTTALDVTIQAQIIELLRELQRELGTAILLITHDLGVVNELADRIAVMYAGRIVEQGERVDVLSNGSHPYTQGLLRSIPAQSRRGRALCEIPGVVPSPRDWPAGCRFSTRCDRVQERCHGEVPGSTTVAAGHTLHCFDVADDVAR